jgi:hypothetical protein
LPLPSNGIDTLSDWVRYEWDRYIDSYERGTTSKSPSNTSPPSTGTTASGTRSNYSSESVLSSPSSPTVVDRHPGLRPGLLKRTMGPGFSGYGDYDTPRFGPPLSECYVGNPSSPLSPSLLHGFDNLLNDFDMNAASIL